MENEFYTKIVNNWGENDEEKTNDKTVLEVFYRNDEDEFPVCLLLEDVHDDLTESYVAIDLTRKQILELSYSLLRINWDLEKNSASKVIDDLTNQNAIATYEIISQNTEGEDKS